MEKQVLRLRYAPARSARRSDEERRDRGLRYGRGSLGQSLIGSAKSGARRGRNSGIGELRRPSRKLLGGASQVGLPRRRRIECCDRPCSPLRYSPLGSPRPSVCDVRSVARGNCAGPGVLEARFFVLPLSSLLFCFPWVFVFLDFPRRRTRSFEKPWAPSHPIGCVPAAGTMEVKVGFRPPPSAIRSALEEAGGLATPITC